MRIVRAFTIFLAVLAVSMNTFSQRPGNPENWCRNGSFPFDSAVYRVGTVTGNKGQKVYFYNDLNDSCPAGEGCKDKAYVIPGDKVVVARSLDGFACSWFSPTKGLPTVGWIKLEDLDLAVSRSVPPLSSWIGTWTYAENTISFTDNKLAGYLNVTGEAFWQGLGDNVHLGSLDGRFGPIRGVLRYSDGEDKYDCKATMRLVENFLVVADNMNCGGANVSFSGVYRKKK